MIKSKYFCGSLMLCLTLSAQSLAAKAPEFGSDQDFSPASKKRILPPEIPWQGRSLEFAVQADDPWVTAVEASNFHRSDNYESSVNYLKKLAKESSLLQLITLPEKTPQGRDMVMAVVAKGGKSPSDLIKNGKPTVFIEAEIHPGESNGKDAGLMYLRDLLISQKHAGILDKVNILFVPSVNPDGDMRRSPYSRVNQNGPDETGSRLNANNLNLNRDFSKLDSAEIRNIAHVFNAYQPSLFIDTHATDGLNYQYDVTYCDNGEAWAKAGKHWMDKVFNPHVYQQLESYGHLPNTCITMNDPYDLSKGYYPYYSDLARFSNQYADIRGIPAILVELHMLKPYRQQVLGNYVLYKSALEAVASDPGGLMTAVKTDQANRPENVVLTWKEAAKSPIVEFKGVAYTTEPSPITGKPIIRWSNKPETYQVPLTAFTEPDLVVKRPKAYIIPPEWKTVIARLKAHGIGLRVLQQPEAHEVTLYRLKNLEMAEGFEPNRVGGAKLPTYEGHLMIKAKPVAERYTVTYPAGSVEVDTDQALGTLAVNLLNPQSPDSFLSWGFFNDMMEISEEPEDYVLEPMARKMLAESPQLAAEFKKQLKDPKFAKDPHARLMWFFEHTPYADSYRYMYPVGEVD